MYLLPFLNSNGCPVKKGKSKMSLLVHVTFLSYKNSSFFTQRFFNIFGYFSPWCGAAWFSARACMYVCVGRIRCISCSDSPTFETRQREKGKDNLTMHMAEVFPWLASLDCDCFHLTSKAPTTARDLFINYSDGLGISQ